MSLDNRDYMREERPPPAILSSLGPLKIILIANIVIFVLQHVLPSPVLADKDLSGRHLPWGALSLHALSEGRIWTLITHMFVHGNLLHLAMNMLIIFIIGRMVEPLLGPRQFALLYLVSGLAGAAAQLIFYNLLIMDIPMVGASAAGFGLMLAFTTIYPDRILMLIFPIPMRLSARNLGRAALIITAALVVYQLLAPRSGGVSQIAHLAHLGGALGGMAFARVIGYGSGPRPYVTQNFYGDPPPRKKRKAERRKEKIVDAKVVESEDFVSAEIDPILDKINREGMGSLTDQERETLRRGQKKIASRVDRGR